MNQSVAVKLNAALLRSQAGTQTFKSKGEHTWQEVSDFLQTWHQVMLDVRGEKQLKNKTRRVGRRKE